MNPARDATIDAATLAALRKKEKAHDAYLAAARQMAAEQARVLSEPPDDFNKGWLACLRYFNRLIVEGMSREKA